jgi:putative transposase
MPRGLKHFQQTGQLHFITFSCYKRAALLREPEARNLFEEDLERVRQWYEFYITGYVVMPEHVHLLISEPERGNMALCLQMLKQNVAQKLKVERDKPFWYRRYYDFNVWSEKKMIEKLRYMHRNPVTRGLVARPEDWAWSSFRHYLTGAKGTVEIESHWTARRREHLGIFTQIRVRQHKPRPVSAKSAETRTGHPQKQK